jgi:hypothetical protein
VGRPEGKNPLGRPRRRWESTIFRKRDRGKDWFDLAQDRDRCLALVNAVVKLRVP